MSSILTNNGAMVALQTMRSINSGMERAQNEISTGLRVSSAKDNAASWAISKAMESDVAGFRAISENLSLGQSTVAVGRQGAESVTELLTEMKGRIVAAQESNVDREKIQADITALRDQIGSVVGSAQFNGMNLLQGFDDVDVLSSLGRDADGVVSATNISINRQDLTMTQQVFGTDASRGDQATVSGAGDIADAASTTIAIGSGTIEAGDSFSVSLSADFGAAEGTYEVVASGGDTAESLTARLGEMIAGAVGEADVTGITATITATGVEIANTTGGALTGAVAHDAATQQMSGGVRGGGLAALANIDVSSGAGATNALDAIEGLIQTGINAAADLGSAEKRIDIQSGFVSNLMDGLRAGIGSLVDADMTEASARLQALQVQQQLGVQALSIANQQPQLLLSLFR